MALINNFLYHCSMKKILFLLLLIPSLVFSQELKDFAKESVLYKYMPTSSCGEIIDYNYYSVSFCEKYKLSEWSIHLLTKKRLLSDSHPRTNNFRQDPNLNGSDASIRNYKGSSYDRGHLVPAADMNFNKVGLSESFFMTNIVPQNPHFNRGPLKLLERKFREWTHNFDSIVVITGCIFNDPFGSSVALEYIGPDEIIVPYLQYKVFIDIQNRRSIAFFFNNDKTQPSLNQTLFESTVAIDYLESITGLDFFSKLPDEIELMFEFDTGIDKLIKE